MWFKSVRIRSMSQEWESSPFRRDEFLTKMKICYQNENSISKKKPNWILGAFTRHILQKHFCFFFLTVLYLLGDNRRLRFHDNKSSTECWFNCSIVTVISLIIERLRRVWWRDKRYVKFYFLRKLSKTVKRVTRRGCFFVWWRLIVKPITYPDSAKLQGLSHTKH